MDETKSLILAENAKAKVQVAAFDLNDKKALKAAVEEAAKLFGGLNVVIANGTSTFLSEIEPPPLPHV